MARKVRTVVPAGGKKPTHFTLLVEKISIRTMGVIEPTARATIICDLRDSLLSLPSAYSTIIFNKQLFDLKTFTYDQISDKRVQSDNAPTHHFSNIVMND